MKKLLSIALSLTLLAAVEATLRKPASAAIKKSALIYGDSLMYEARPTVDQLFSTKSAWTALVRAWPGIPLCYWNDNWIDSDLVTYKPNIVSIETHGGVAGPCMESAGGGQMVQGSQEFYDKYRADMNSFFSKITSTCPKIDFL